MQIQIKKVGDVTIVGLAGELSAQTTGEVQEAVLSLDDPDARIILDMGRVPFMSSAGLRMLLVLYRTIKGRSGEILLVGLSEDLRSTMALTGFLDLFRHKSDLEAGLADMDALLIRM
jgi:anti-sigma B factor antagonist